jgi:hypothetical protein
LHDTPALPDGTLEYRNGARSIYDACIIDLAKAGGSDQEQIECIQEARKKHQQGIAKEVLSSKDARQWMGNLSVYRLDEEGRPRFEGGLDVERKEELKILIEAGAKTLCQGEKLAPDAQLVRILQSEAARIGLSDEDPNVSKLLGVLKSTSASARTTACQGLRR